MLPLGFPATLAARSKFLWILSLASGCLFLFYFYTGTYVDHTLLGKQVSNSAITVDDDQFDDTRFPFQDDLPIFMRLNVDFTKYKGHKPHNFAFAPAQETFATFFCTPNSSVYDPYFVATLNLVYRNLWSPEIASKQRPFTVFVAPFISQEQRNIFAGAGAIVKELDLVPWHPNIAGVWGRWRDQFSKLHFWNQTQYSKIAFMDSDAFPIRNIDSVFDEVVPQMCNASKLSTEDEQDKDALCEYTFAAVHDIGEGVNGGFLVLSPNVAMHQRLLRNYVRIDQYDNHVAEQSYFRWQFAEDGPFPPQLLPRKYNAYFPNAEDEGKVSVIHQKLWAFDPGWAPWLIGIWDHGWQEAIQFFNSPAFVDARELDGLML